MKSRPHTTDFPQKVAKEGNWDPLFQGNPGWLNIIIWLDFFGMKQCSSRAMVRVLPLTKFPHGIHWVSLDDLTVDRVSLESMEILESLMLNIPEFVDQPT